MNPAPLLGQKSTGCPEVECFNVCEVCEHKQWVFDNIEPINGNPQDLLALMNAILDTHEEFLDCICNFDPGICKRGENVSFPCIQCGLIDPICITYGDPVLKVDCTPASTCICFSELMFDNCTQTVVDLSADPYTQIYTDIVEALEQLSGGFATGETIINFLQRFLPNATILSIDGGFYRISIGPASPEILAILPILATLVPIPIGAQLKFYVECEPAVI